MSICIAVARLRTSRKAVAHGCALTVGGRAVICFPANSLGDRPQTSEKQLFASEYMSAVADSVPIVASAEVGECSGAE
ncbi:MAG: hypothetical protein ABIP78_08090 [Pyrinomonadaceae bacterium]